MRQDIVIAEQMYDGPATARIVVATKRLVDALLDCNISNRNVRPGVVKQYSEQIMNNRWFLTNQGIGLSIEGVLLDGQHRLLALRDSGYPAVPLLLITGLHPDSQRVVDHHAKRSARDVFRLLENTTVAHQVPAVVNVLWKDRHGWPKAQPHINDAFDLYEAWRDNIDAVFAAAGLSKDFAAPYLAAWVWCDVAFGVHTFADMIEQVRTGANMPMKSPQLALRKFMDNSRGGGSTVQRERFIKTLRATFAFVRSETMAVLRAVDPRNTD